MQNVYKFFYTTVRYFALETDRNTDHHESWVYQLGSCVF